jgi:hypothetical protein
MDEEASRWTVAMWGHSDAMVSPLKELDQYEVKQNAVLG